MTNAIPFEDAVTGEGDNSKISDYRKSRIKWCPQNQEWAWVYNKLHDYIKEANEGYKEYNDQKQAEFCKIKFYIY